MQVVIADRSNARYFSNSRINRSVEVDVKCFVSFKLRIAVDSNSNGFGGFPGIEGEASCCRCVIAISSVSSAV